MKLRSFLVLGLACLCFTGCSFAGGNANRYNPYAQSRLPENTQSPEIASIIEKMGGHTTTIQDEASYRKYWKEELYPVVFGDKKAPNTILVLLNYSAPQSQHVWNAVVQATSKLEPSKVQVVVFANSTEQYGTELMGYGIWVSIMRPKQAMAYYSYTLGQWNDVKRRQAMRGMVRNFQYEFDGVAGDTEMPFVHTFIESLKPPVPHKQQAELLDYAYDAGNVNMYQAVEVSNYYGVQQLPAVIINDAVLTQVTVSNILNALK